MFVEINVIMNESLEKISKTLGSLIQNPEARVFTCVQTGYDETGIVATADAYLRFAKELIDFVVAAQSGQFQNCSYGEVQGPCDSSVGSVFSPISEVKLDSALLVKQEEEAEKAMSHFQ